MSLDHPAPESSILNPESAGKDLVSKVMGLQMAPANAECDDEDPGVTALHKKFDLPKGSAPLPLHTFGDIFQQN
jgi:hypothetical protein